MSDDDRNGVDNTGAPKPPVSSFLHVLDGGRADPDELRRRHVNMRKLAGELECSLAWLKEVIARRDDFPIVRRGNEGMSYVFDLDTVKPWWIANGYGKRAREAGAPGQEEGTGEKAPEQSARSSADERAAIAKAGLLEISLASKAGRLVDADLMRSEITDGVTILARFLDRLPLRMAARGMPEEWVGQMGVELDEARRELVRRVKLAPPDQTLAASAES